MGTIASYVGYKKGWAERKPVDRKYYVNSDIYKASSHSKAVEAIEAEAEHIDMEVRTSPRFDLIRFEFFSKTKSTSLLV